MRRFVRSEVFVGIACGFVAFLVIWFSHAAGGTARLIAWVAMGIGFVILMVPERIRLWREFHGSPPPRRSKR